MASKAAAATGQTQVLSILGSRRRLEIAWDLSRFSSNDIFELLYSLASLDFILIDNKSEMCIRVDYQYAYRSYIILPMADTTHHVDLR